MPAGTMARLTMVAGITAAVTLADTAGAAEFIGAPAITMAAFIVAAIASRGYDGGYLGGGFRRR